MDIPKNHDACSFATVAVRVPPGLVKSGAGACRGFARSRELPRGSITSNSAVASFAAPSPPPAVWPRGGTGSKVKAFLGVIPKPANRVWEMPRGPQAAGRAVWGLQHDPHRPKPHVPGPAGRETFRRAGGTVAVGNEPASRHTPFVMPSMLLYHKRGLEFQAAWKVGLVFGLCALQRPPPFPPGGSGPSPVGGSMPLWGNYDRSLLSVGGDSRLVIGPGQKHAKSPHTVGRIVTLERLTRNLIPVPHPRN